MYLFDTLQGSLDELGIGGVSAPDYRLQYVNVIHIIPDLEILGELCEAYLNTHPVPPPPWATVPPPT